MAQRRTEGPGVSAGVRELQTLSKTVYQFFFENSLGVLSSIHAHIHTESRCRICPVLPTIPVLTHTATPCPPEPRWASWDIGDGPLKTNSCRCCFCRWACGAVCRIHWGTADRRLALAGARYFQRRRSVHRINPAVCTDCARRQYGFDGCACGCGSMYSLRSYRSCWLVHRSQRNGWRIQRVGGQQRTPAEIRHPWRIRR